MERKISTVKNKRTDKGKDTGGHMAAVSSVETDSD